MDQGLVCPFADILRSPLMAELWDRLSDYCLGHRSIPLIWCFLFLSIQALEGLRVHARSQNPQGFYYSDGGTRRDGYGPRIRRKIYANRPGNG